MLDDCNKKIFVTVGTTNYDRLIQFCDNKLNPKKYNFRFQIGNGRFIPKNHQFFRYSDNIEQYYLNSDIIITHAGAGTVYKLLEESRNLIIVPNLNLIDNHQVELAEFVKENNYAPVIYDLSDLSKIIDNYHAMSFNKYHNDSSALIKSILQYLES